MGVAKGCAMGGVGGGESGAILEGRKADAAAGGHCCGGI